MRTSAHTTNLTKRCDMSKNVSWWHHTLQGTGCGRISCFGKMGSMLQCTWERLLWHSLCQTFKPIYTSKTAAGKHVRAVSSNMSNEKFKGSVFLKLSPPQEAFLDKPRAFWQAAWRHPPRHTHTTERVQYLMLPGWTILGRISSFPSIPNIPRTDMESYISRCCSMASGLKLFCCSLTVTVVQVHVDGQ